MPRQNGTGPQGAGPGTGWGMGSCGGDAARGRRIGKGGAGRGFGWRRFWGYYPSPTLSSKEEKEILSEEAKILEEELKVVKDRLNKIKK